MNTEKTVASIMELQIIEKRIEKLTSNLAEEKSIEYLDIMLTHMRNLLKSIEEMVGEDSESNED